MIDAKLLPGFSNGSFGVVFFSRGQGRGQAVPDIAIGRELKSQVPNLDIRFVSYGVGADTFIQRGLDVIDFGMSDKNPFLDTVVNAGRLLEHLRPQLVIAHGEPAALPAAQVFQIPSVFITDFFYDPGVMATRALDYVEEIIFMGDRGMFTEPPYLRNRIHYVGAPVRRFNYSISDAVRARKELGLLPDGTVISCMPGSWTETQGPIAGLVLGAFDMLPFSSKHLVWLAGLDYNLIRERVGRRSDITVKAQDWEIDRLMVASNLVVTRATRMTLRELSALGVPSISLSHGFNWPDDVLASHLPSNTALQVKTTNPKTLSHYMIERIMKGNLGMDRRGMPDGIFGAASQLRCRVECMQSGVRSETDSHT